MILPSTGASLLDSWAAKILGTLLWAAYGAGLLYIFWRCFRACTVPRAKGAREGSLARSMMIPIAVAILLLGLLRPVLLRLEAPLLAKDTLLGAGGETLIFTGVEGRETTRLRDAMRNALENADTP